MKATAYLILATRHQKKTGKYPVKVRVVFEGRPKDFKTDIDLTEEEYQGAIVDRPRAAFKDIHIELTTFKNKAHKALMSLNPFSFEKFENDFYSETKTASNIWPFYEEYIKILNDEGRLKTRDSYRSSMNSLKNFRSKLSFSDITFNFLKDYEKWMLSTGKSCNRIAQGHLKKTEPEGNSITTIGIYLRNLRALYNDAISKQVIKKDENYPFGKRKYVVPSSKNCKRALSQDEIALIYRYQPIPYSPEDKAKDFWMFSYLCNGINFKDIALMKMEAIQGNIIRFIREKTKNSTRGKGESTSCYIHEITRAIINKWQAGNKAGSKEYVFSIISKGDDLEQQMKKVGQFIKNTNKYVKRICSQLGIEKNVTTYYGRHSAATIMKNAGASIEQIQEALGHQSSNTTRKYIKSFDDESIIELSKSLSNFI